MTSMEALSNGIEGFLKGEVNSLESYVSGIPLDSTTSTKTYNLLLRIKELRYKIEALMSEKMTPQIQENKALSEIRKEVYKTAIMFKYEHAKNKLDHARDISEFLVRILNQSTFKKEDIRSRVEALEYLLVYLISKRRGD